MDKVKVSVLVNFIMTTDVIYHFYYFKVTQGRANKHVQSVRQSLCQLAKHHISIISGNKRTKNVTEHIPPILPRTRLAALEQPSQVISILNSCFYKQTTDFLKKNI